MFKEITKKKFISKYLCIWKMLILETLKFLGVYFKIQKGNQKTRNAEGICVDNLFYYQKYKILIDLSEIYVFQCLEKNIEKFESNIRDSETS